MAADVEEGAAVASIAELRYIARIGQFLDARGRKSFRNMLR